MWRFFKKLQTELPYDPANPLLGIQAEKSRIERNTYTPILITASFIIARTRKQPRCPSTDEWIKKLWYIYTMEYYAAIKRNEFELNSRKIKCIPKHKIINSAAMNIGVPVSLSILVSSVCMPSSGIAGS